MGWNFTLLLNGIVSSDRDRLRPLKPYQKFFMVRKFVFSVHAFQGCTAFWSRECDINTAQLQNVIYLPLSVIKVKPAIIDRLC